MGIELKERRQETMGSKFKLGDIVWGKVKCHPWWPGKIYSKDLAPSLVDAKTKGFLLVTFFGDCTYRWMDPMELIPFEPHYLEKANQSRTRAFLMAVQEAINELSKRAALGLTCRCRNPSNFSPANASGLLKVDIDGYEEGATYSVDQVERSREEFKPVEMLFFLHQLALRPILTCRNTDFLKNVSRVLAYRKVVYQEKDDTYDEAFDNYDETFDNYDETFEMMPSVDAIVDANDRGKALVQVPLSGQSGASEAEGEGSVLGKRVNLAKPIGGEKHSRTDDLGKASEDSVMDLIIEEEPEEPGAILVMEFLPRATMPSNSELKALFAHFRPIDISATYASWNSSTCQIVLKQKSDAQAAYDYVVRNESLFRNANVSCYLSPFKKVQMLSSSSVDGANGSDGGGKFHLFAQDDYQENNSVKSQQTIPSSALPPRVPVYQKSLSQEPVAQITDAMNKTCSKNLASKMENILAATTSNSQDITDISGPLLKLVEECEEFLLSFEL